MLPHFPGKSGLGALEPALSSIHATVDALRRYSSVLIDIEDEELEGGDGGQVNPDRNPSPNPNPNPNPNPEPEPKP